MTRACLHFLVLLISVIAGVWFMVPLYQVDFEEPNMIENNASLRCAFESGALDTAPSSYNAKTGQYVWGRTTKGDFSMDIHPLNGIQSFTQMKEFIWLSVTSGPLLISFAIVQFHYQSTLVMQIYRRASEQGPELSFRGRFDLPLVPQITGLGGQWVPNATGAISPHAPGHSISFWMPAMNTEQRKTQPTAHVAFSGKRVHLFMQGAVYDGLSNATSAKRWLRVQGSAEIPHEGVMGLVFPIGPHRASVVRKLAAAKLTSPLAIYLEGQNPMNVGPEGYLAMDYTRGLLRRHTEWYWACVTAPVGVGLHLSSGTYDVDGISAEGTIYDGRSGKTSFLNERVSFNRIAPLPGDQVGFVWSITSESVSLIFTARDGQDGQVNIGVIKTNLDHRWGTYTGTVRVGEESVLFDAVPGVFEEHFAIW